MGNPEAVGALPHRGVFAVLHALLSAGGRSVHWGKTGAIAASIHWLLHPVTCHASREAACQLMGLFIVDSASMRQKSATGSNSGRQSSNA